MKDHCAKCGIIFEKENRRDDYCPDCGRMPASGHTSGPWYAANMGLGSRGKGPYTYPLGTDPDEAVANAKLIAAAPELLAACIKAVGPKRHAGTCHCLDCDAQDSMRAAIKKATE